MYYTCYADKNCFVTWHWPTVNWTLINFGTNDGSWNALSALSIHSHCQNLRRPWHPGWLGHRPAVSNIHRGFKLADSITCLLRPLCRRTSLAHYHCLWNTMARRQVLNIPRSASGASFGSRRPTALQPGCRLSQLVYSEGMDRIAVRARPSSLHMTTR